MTQLRTQAPRVHDHVELQSTTLSVGVDTSCGARLTHLTDRRTGEQWLYPGDPHRVPTPGAAFQDGPRGGFDECLPSITSYTPPGDHGGAVDDHGDFWASPWETLRQTTHALTTRTTRREHPLQLTRTLELHPQQAALTLFYELTNSTNRPYPYLYSAHPLFAFDGDAELDLPAGTDLIGAFGDPLPAGHIATWPHVGDATSTRLDEIALSGRRENYKYFARHTGPITYTVHGRRRRLRLLQSQHLGWVGVCVNRGQWPTPEVDERWVALEPTTTPTDDLGDAIRAGIAPVLSAGDTHAWSISIDLIPTEQPHRTEGAR